MRKYPIIKVEKPHIYDDGPYRGFTLVGTCKSGFFSCTQEFRIDGYFDIRENFDGHFVVYQYDEPEMKNFELIGIFSPDIEMADVMPRFQKRLEELLLKHH